jgi:hypothetical protein
MLLRPFTRHPRAGFSLIWVSIILTAAAIIMVSTLPGQEAGSNNAKITSTIQNLDRVEEAMRAFMARNLRRPCPADGSYAVNTANFGVEAATPGTCTGGTPAAPLGPDAATGYLVGGTIPTKSLELDDSYAFDQWGRRITYVVDSRATSSFTCGTLQNSVKSGGHAAVQINDATGTQLENVMYAYISHGPDGHGAFPAQGSSVANRINSGSTNANARINAGVDASFTYNTTNFTNVKVRNSWIQPSAGDTGFEDLTYYREDIKNTCCFNPSGDSYTGPDLMVGLYQWPATPSLLGYKLACGSWQHTTPDPSPVRSNINIFVQQTTNDTYMVTRGQGDYCRSYQRSGMAWTEIANAFPASCIHNASDWGKPSMSADGTYVAQYNDLAPYLYLYKSNGAGVYSTIAAPAAPNNSGGGGRSDFNVMSSDGKYLAIRPSAGAGWGTLYQRTGDTFTSITPPATPPNPVVGVGFSPDGKYLVVTTNSGVGWGTPNYAYVYTITDNGDGTSSFAQIASSPLRFGNNQLDLNLVKFSDDSKYLALPTFGGAGGPHIAVYSISAGDTFTPVTIPLWRSDGYPPQFLSFSHDDKYIAMSYSAGYGSGQGHIDLLQQTNSTTYKFALSLTGFAYALDFRH